MAAAGRPLCAVKILGDSEQITVQQIKQLSPQTFVVYRHYRDSDGGPDVSAQEFFRKFIDPYPPRHGADAYQLYGEWDDASQNAIKFREDQILWCESHSGDYLKRVLDPVWSTGWPGGDPMATYSQVHILAHLRFLRDHNQYFGLDEYYRDDLNFELWRYFDRVYPFLPDDLKRYHPRMLFGELGQDNIARLSRAELLALFRQWNSKLIQYSFVIAGFVYCLGDSIGWAGYNFAPHMAVLAEV